MKQLVRISDVHHADRIALHIEVQDDGCKHPLAALISTRWENNGLTVSRIREFSLRVGPRGGLYVKELK